MKNLYFLGFYVVGGMSICRVHPAIYSWTFSTICTLLVAWQFVGSTLRFTAGHFLGFYVVSETLMCRVHPTIYRYFNYGHVHNARGAPP